MSLLKPHMGRNQIWIMSVFGAIAHNAGQLLVAVAITETLEVAWYGVVLLIAGIVTGFFTGQCAQAVLNHMDKLKPKS